MPVDEVIRWIEQVSGPGWKWYVKILSGNDTLANESHQAGPYIARRVIFEQFPSVQASSDLNPRSVFPVRIDSHGAETHATAIWYNNRFIGEGTRNEARVTGWGGRQSPILDPDSTGSVCVFAFHRLDGQDSDECRVWLCSAPDEEDELEKRLGPVEPGIPLYYDASGRSPHPVVALEVEGKCRLTADQLPAHWLLNFPTAAEVVAKAVALRPNARRQGVDERLLLRRHCEFELFRSVEEVAVAPRVREGFATVDLFVDLANTVTNRRRSRSGASLQLHAKTVFEEEGLPHSVNGFSEGHKRPDFLFPSAEAYHDAAFPAERLRMLAAKTTCKDRWRQILNEADRVPRKHLLTLQEGISPNQFAEMRDEEVTLVVPRRLHDSYAEAIRPQLLSLEQFIATTRAACS